MLYTCFKVGLCFLSTYCVSSVLFLAFEVWCYLVMIPALVCIEHCSCFVLLASVRVHVPV